MTTRLNPYISFRDTAREALEFYHGVFGGDLNMNTFAEFQMSEDPADADKIMHGQLDAPNGMTLMAADTPSSMDVQDTSNITISLSGDDESQLRGFWDKLADGGSVTVPLEMAPWGDHFGQLTDRFGVAWMVNIAGQGGQGGQGS
ncbi:PhnB protein [Georgenia soli]|uniref:PhnB protein n=1 Tax=Georgenia soli TaxID=638953 RepID=A0A2A9ES10_9MICO|nr:VOC family protein [Georgenia soli]PFG40989.1 PhnB protein [Georgenia soli]